MINSNLSAAYSSMTGLRKQIHQSIISTFQTFIPVEDRIQDTFTRSSQEQE
jgi:hypothetical protein